MSTSQQKNVKGVLGEKLGMTQVWDADNRLIPVTVIKAGPCVVTQVRGASDGYEAVQIAYGAIDPRKVNKPMTGHFEKAGVTPRRHLVELRTADAAQYEVGQEVTVEIFEAGQKVDVSGTSKGKGFAGVMKRHGFHGGPRSHGQKHSERAPGSIGGSGGRAGGRVAKGMRMAGRMGSDTVSVKGLKVLAVDTTNNLLLVSGAIPGRRGTLIEIKATNA